MSRTFHHKKGRSGDKPIRVRGIRKETPDLRRIARALISMAELAQAEAEAQISHESEKEAGSPTDTAPDTERDPEGRRT